ncbi:MAG TPA: PA14 domain-containing protein [Chloroflexota bacterium]|nr:PA14 domain-containing protein [Chloroflexota bacterium]HUM69322.1 PA14 domain-containing protein [Chloroflexota bacterium]
MTTHHAPQRGQHGRSGSTLEWILLIILIILLIVVGGLLTWQIRRTYFAPPAQPTLAPPVVAPPATAAEPQVQITPGIGVAGTLITVWGRGWQPDDRLIVCLDDLGDPADPPIYAESTVNGVGEFYATFTFPTDVPWRSLPDIPVVVESRTTQEKQTAVFKLITGSPTAVADVATTSAPGIIIPATATPWPPTPTPVLPTATPACIYNMAFVTDVTIPDDTAIPPGINFTKTWRLRNNGTCAWPAGSSWVFAGGDQMNGPNAVSVPAARPGETADVSVLLTAPTVPGRYTGYWTLRLPDGTLMNQSYYVRIIVPAPTATPTRTPLPVAATPTAVPATATPTVTQTPTAMTPTPTPVVIYDWRGEYFSNAGLAGSPTLVRNDATINFNWGTGAPASGMPADNFSARWLRTFSMAEGNYRFYAAMDDGLRLYVDDVLIINEWRDASYRQVSVDRWLSSGSHLIRVEYYEHLGDALAQVWWEPVAGYPDWRGEYWANKNLAGTPTLVRNDRNIDFNWGFGAVAAGMPDEQFSARWTRTINFTAGTYRFFARADDGVRVLVDGQKIIDFWRPNDGRRIFQADMTLQGNHTVVVEYYEETIAAEVHVWYERIGN